MKSDLLPVTSGVPQGSLLGPYLFLTMCYDILPYHKSSVLTQYADDTTILCPMKSPSDLDIYVNNEISNMQQWSQSNGFKLNRLKTQCLIVTKRSHSLSSQSTLPNQQDFIKILGVTWTPLLSWDLHFHAVETRCSRRLYLLRILKNVVSHNELWQIFNAVIVSALMYSIELFGPLSCKTRRIVHRIFKRKNRIICSHDCCCSFPTSFEEMHKKRILSLLFKAQKQDHPLYSIVPHPTNRGHFPIPFSKSTRRRNTFSVFSAIVCANIHID